MAHKKAGGSTSNVHDSKSKRLGVKLFGGQKVNAGGIIIRQRGTKFLPGENTYCGKDYTIHAKIDGEIRFGKIQKLLFDGNKRRATIVHVDAVTA